MQKTSRLEDNLTQGIDFVFSAQYICVFCSKPQADALIM